MRGLSVLMCLVVLVMAQPAPARQADPFIMVQASKLWAAPPQTILVLRNGASYLERWAAKEFVEYVHRASKSRVLLPQAYGGAPADWDGSVILYGVAGQAPFADVAAAAVPMHGFTIRTEPKRLIVIGASEQGASNALYWLLREKIGVRWYMPTRLGEEVPVHDRIALEPMNVTIGPDIPARSADVRCYGTTANRTPNGYRRDSKTLRGAVTP